MIRRYLLSLLTAVFVLSCANSQDMKPLTAESIPPKVRFTSSIVCSTAYRLVRADGLAEGPSSMASIVWRQISSSCFSS